MDSIIVRIIGEKVKMVTEGVWRTILVNIKSLPAPTTERHSIMFKSHVGLEKRDVSTFCAAVYSELSRFVQYTPQLLVPSLLPFITQPLIIGFEALCSYVVKVNDKCINDQAVRNVGVSFRCDVARSADHGPLLPEYRARTLH